MGERVITGSTREQARRWEIPDVDFPPGVERGDQGLLSPRQHVSRQHESESAPTPLTLEQLEAIEQDAREEGLKQGNAEGFQQGYAQGLVEGKAQGLVEGREQGFAQGKAEGLKAGEAEIQAQNQHLRGEAERLRQILDALTPFIVELDAELEQELVEMVVVVARQVLRRELRLDPGQIVAAVREAVALLPSNATRKLRLFVHPDDAKLLREALALDSMETPWRLHEDPTITRGGARLETDTARLDATLERRMNAVIAELWGDERRRHALAETSTPAAAPQASVSVAAPAPATTAEAQADTLTATQDSAAADPDWDDFAAMVSATKDQKSP